MYWPDFNSSGLTYPPWCDHHHSRIMIMTSAYRLTAKVFVLMHDHQFMLCICESDYYH